MSVSLIYKFIQQVNDQRMSDLQTLVANYDINYEDACKLLGIGPEATQRRIDALDAGLDAQATEDYEIEQAGYNENDEFLARVHADNEATEDKVANQKKVTKPPVVRKKRALMTDEQKKAAAERRTAKRKLLAKS